jgi:hypothetical protein
MAVKHGSFPGQFSCLEGFHICAAYQMAKMHKPKRGPGRTWIFPQSVDVFQECGLKTMEEYIAIRRQTIAVYVATHPILNKMQTGQEKEGSNTMPLVVEPAHGPGRQRHIWVRQVMVHLGFRSCFCMGMSMPGGYQTMAYCVCLSLV